MGYHLLNAKQQAEIYHRKLLELEAEHVRLELELRLADAADIENDSVVEARSQLDVLVRQMATLASWIMPAPAEEVPVASNGHPTEGD